MSLFQSTFKNTEANIPPDHIYLNGTIYNNNYLDPTLAQYVPAEIKQTRSSPFLDNCSTYNCAIVKFAINDDCIPRLYQPFNTTTLTTPWWVSVSYNGVFYDQPVLLPIRDNPDGTQSRITFSIQAFLDNINQAWGLAQAAAIVGGAPAPPAGDQVFINLDNTTGFYNVNVPVSYGLGLDANVPADGIAVHMSLALYQLFGSFDAYVPRGPQITYNNHEVTFVRNITGDNLVYMQYGTIIAGPVTPAVYNYFQLRQDAPKPSNVMNITRLIITTSTLPIYPEFSAPIFTSNLTVSGNNTEKLVTDFYIGQDGVLENDNASITYIANPYRLISMTGSTALSSWDLKVYFATSDNQIFPLYIPPYGKIDFKLLFLKKGLES